MGGRTFLGVIAVVAIATSACSFLLATDQCVSSADCLAKGQAFAGTTCSAGACVADVARVDAGFPDATATPDAEASAPECSTNGECIAKRGVHHVCRVADRRCVSLLSEDCFRVVGDDRDDNAIYFGALLDTAGSGRDVALGAEMAVADFERAVVGLPGGPGDKLRPVVLVECREENDPIRASRHLVETVRVPAILGGSASEVTTRVAAEVTIPKRVLLVSPSASSYKITTLADDSLVWRTVPSDKVEGSVMGLAARDVETLVKQVTGASTVKLASLVKGDDYGKGLSLGFLESLRLNGVSAAENLTRGSYVELGVPAVATLANLRAAAEQAVAAAPHIVLVAAASDAAELIAGIEAAWPVGASPPPRPQYLLSNGATTKATLDYVAANEAVRARVRGTRPGNPRTVVNETFRRSYGASFPDSDPTTGAAGAYDAIYLFAYSTVVTGRAPVTGFSLAQGIRTYLMSSDILDVGSDNVAKIIRLLQILAPVDLRGASGSLTFDGNGDVTTDVDVFCLVRSAQTTAVRLSGQLWNATTASMEGTFTACP